MALKQDRNTARRDGVDFRWPVGAGQRIFAGSLVGVLGSGVAVPAGTAGIVAIVGIAQEHVDNRDGEDGDKNVNVRRGVFALKGPGITPADYGKRVRAVDDESVALVQGNELAAGTVCGVDDEGVWVEF